MNELISELRRIAEPVWFVGSFKRILEACDTGDWQAVTASANAALRDPDVVRVPTDVQLLTEWAQRANRLTLRAKAA